MFQLKSLTLDNDSPVIWVRNVHGEDMHDKRIKGAVVSERTCCVAW